MQLHAIGNCGPRVDFIVGQAGDYLDHALAFLEVVDNRRGRHAEDVQVRVALGGQRRERRDELPSLGDVLDGPLLGIMDFVHNHKIDGFALDERPDVLGGVWLLERLVIEDQVTVRAEVGSDAEASGVEAIGSGRIAGAYGLPKRPEKQAPNGD
jgi:hypothetical protein